MTQQKRKTASKPDEASWYVKKEEQIRGPYRASEIHRRIRRQEMRCSDKVSHNKKRWEPLTQVPELIPEELLFIDLNLTWNKSSSAEKITPTNSQENLLTLHPITERIIALAAGALFATAYWLPYTTKAIT